jgi:hypothetical protein
MEPRGTIFIARISTGSFFSASTSQKVWIPYVPLAITVKNNAPARIFQLGTLSLKLFPRKLGEPIILHEFLLGVSFYQQLILKNYGYSRFP